MRLVWVDIQNQTSIGKHHLSSIDSEKRTACHDRLEAQDSTHLQNYPICFICFTNHKKVFSRSEVVKVENCFVVDRDIQEDIILFYVRCIWTKVQGIKNFSFNLVVFSTATLSCTRLLVNRVHSVNDGALTDLFLLHMSMGFATDVLIWINHFD